MKTILKTTFLAIVLVSVSEVSAQSSIPNDTIKGQARHEFWQRGTHPNEMNLGHYVVVAMCFKESDAQVMAESFEKANHSKPSYGFLSKKDVWCLYFEIKSTEDDLFKKARTLRNEYAKQKMYKNAWILTVHE